MEYLEYDPFPIGFRPIFRGVVNLRFIFLQPIRAVQLQTGRKKNELDKVYDFCVGQVVKVTHSQKIDTVDGRNPAITS